MAGEYEGATLHIYCAAVEAALHASIVQIGPPGVPGVAVETISRQAVALGLCAEYVDVFYGLS